MPFTRAGLPPNTLAMVLLPTLFGEDCRKGDDVEKAGFIPRMLWLVFAAVGEAVPGMKNVGVVNEVVVVVAPNAVSPPISPTPHANATNNLTWVIIPV